MKAINEMTTKELKAFAKESTIDISEAANKAEMITTIESQIKNEEEVNMEENQVVDGQEVLPVETEEVKATYTLDDGSECSRSAYIRQEFNKDKSRQDLAKELGLKYYIIYSATANMYNAAHPENGGAGAAGKGSVLVAKINKELQFLNADGVVVETAEEAVKIPRADLMRELATAGLDRSAIKDYFQVPYATVYAATKEIFATEGGEKRGRKTIIHPDTQVETNRADYIRELYNEGAGLDRREIAVALTKMTGELVDYATVWAATKPKKEEVVETEVPADAPVEETTEV